MTNSIGFGRTLYRADDLRGKSRRRREALARAASLDGAPRRVRNDLRPHLDMVERAICDLRPPARNVRPADPAHVREVANSIATLGFCAPVLIDRENRVLDGWVRVEAARQAGLTSLPCVVADHLNPSEARLLRIALNRLGEKGRWDLDELKLEITELIIEEAPIEIAGFSGIELDQITLDEEPAATETGPLEPDPDAEPIEVVVAQNLGYGDVRPTLRELAEGGANLLIAHASGYNTAAPEIGAEMHVPVAIVDRPEARKPGEVADYTLSGHEGAYLAGRLAAKTTRTGTVGIVVSGEPPAWNSQSAAFAQGVKAENPKVNVRYAVIGPAAYSDAAGAKRVTDAVIASGADIIFGQGNGSSFGMIQSVETSKATDGGKVYFIDVIGDKSSLDKGNLLSSVIWNITPVYSAMIEDLRDGKFGTHGYSIKLADDSVHLLKTSHIPEKAWTELEGLKQDIVSGKIKVEPHFDAAAVHALVTEVAVAK